MEEDKDTCKRILTTIHKMIENEPLYSKYSIESLTQDLILLYKTIQDERDRTSTALCEGKWVQVLEHQRKPFYAKIERVLDESTVTLEGVYYSDNGVVTQRRYLKEFMLPIPRELGNALEYCNGINLFEQEVHLNENINQEGI